MIWQTLVSFDRTQKDVTNSIKNQIHLHPHVNRILGAHPFTQPPIFATAQTVVVFPPKSTVSANKNCVLCARAFLMVMLTCVIKICGFSSFCLPPLSRFWWEWFCGWPWPFWCHMPCAGIAIRIEAGVFLLERNGSGPKQQVT